LSVAEPLTANQQCSDGDYDQMAGNRFLLDEGHQEKAAQSD
jgi:hypothetical protein